MVAIALPLLAAPQGAGAIAAGVTLVAGGTLKLWQEHYKFRQAPLPLPPLTGLEGETTLLEKLADFVAGARVPVGFPSPPPFPSFPTALALAAAAGLTVEAAFRNLRNQWESWNSTPYQKDLPYYIDEIKQGAQFVRPVDLKLAPRTTDKADWVYIPTGMGSTIGLFITNWDVITFTGAKGFRIPLRSDIIHEQYNGDVRPPTVGSNDVEILRPDNSVYVVTLRPVYVYQPDGNWEGKSEFITDFAIVYVDGEPWPYTPSDNRAKGFRPTAADLRPVELAAAAATVLPIPLPHPPPLEVLAQSISQTAPPPVPKKPTGTRPQPSRVPVRYPLPAAVPLPDPQAEPAPASAAVPGQVDPRLPTTVGVRAVPRLPRLIQPLPAQRQRTGPDGRPQTQPQPAPTTTRAGSHVVGTQVIPDNGPRPDLVAIASEVGRLEQKTARILRDGPQALPPNLGDLAGLVQQVIQALVGLGDQGSYSLGGPCERDEQGNPIPFADTVETWEWGGSPFLLRNIAQRVDALAEMMQKAQLLRQPTCKNPPPVGELVSVQFREVDQ